MTDDLTVVLDVGKTLAKLSLWRRSGQIVARAARPNEPRHAGAYVGLDVLGIEAWLAQTLAEFSTLGRIKAFIPVGHGAAAAIVRDGRLACPPLDYEDPKSQAARSLYEAQRDPFGQTGSPSLPGGLNLGAQLHFLESLRPNLLADGALILTWPQYWAWRLCGVAASEMTSLGCHSDLWRPREGGPSALARRRGWDRHLPPMARAGAPLGRLNAEWVSRTGLGCDVEVYCGLHDSNAALLAARAFAEIADKESTVLSTGTWFVAMRSPAHDAAVDLSRLSEGRDCLVNVDAFGKLIPSARFMGGREIEALLGPDACRTDVPCDQAAVLGAVPAVVAAGARVLPTFARGSGPYPHHRGGWINRPTDLYEQRAAVALYAALVANASLDLVGARERVLVEGRFAQAQVFVRALASLRPNDQIFVSDAQNEVSFGALRLIEPNLAPAGALIRIAPLEANLESYAARWLHDVERAEKAA
jgi:sugar (pentulose or hexulose) kinase